MFSAGSRRLRKKIYIVSYCCLLKFLPNMLSVNHEVVSKVNSIVVLSSRVHSLILTHFYILNLF